MGRKRDLTGQRFGRLVVVGDVGYRKSTKRGIWYQCKCDCGKELQIRKDRLASGNTKSCGCLNDELRAFNLKPIKHEDRLKACESNVVEKTDLRIISRTKPKAANTSGITGVSIRKDRNKWLARKKKKKEVHHLGYFANKQDAINARKEAEDKYFKPILEKYGKQQEG